ncbi:MAG: Nif3-like dinuclear metal center hexameric protein [Desulfatiglandaceae bacterium]
MAFKVKHFIELLETIAPLSLAEPWDNPGLQVGSAAMGVKRVFVSLDPTLKAVRLAAASDAQLLFTHHPLIFKPIFKVETTAFPGDVIGSALKQGVAIVSAHTNLDAAKGGINDILADLLGLHNVSVLSPVQTCDQAGLGRIGDLPEPVPLTIFAQKVNRALGTARRPTRVGEGSRHIKRVAVVGGSGGSLVRLAHQKGADLLLTGDVGHHTALEAAALGIALLDGGHFRTEKVAFTQFAEHLAARCSGKGWAVEFESDENEADPMILTD